MRNVVIASNHTNKETNIDGDCDCNAGVGQALEHCAVDEDAVLVVVRGGRQLALLRVGRAPRIAVGGLLGLLLDRGVAVDGRLGAARELLQPLGSHLSVFVDVPKVIEIITTGRAKSFISFAKCCSITKFVRICLLLFW